MRQGLIWLVLAVVAVAPAFGSSIIVNLGSASSFGLLGGTISNTGISQVTGNWSHDYDYGLWPVGRDRYRLSGW